MTFLHTKPNEPNPIISITFDSIGRLHLGRHLEHQHLTPREVDILKCVLQGHSAKEAALKLGLSPRTVEFYVSSIKEKFNCSKRSELVKICLKLGLFRLVLI